MAWVEREKRRGGTCERGGRACGRVVHRYGALPRAGYGMTMRAEVGSRHAVRRRETRRAEREKIKYARGR